MRKNEFFDPTKSYLSKSVIWPMRYMYENDLVFFGGIDIQELLFNSTPVDIGKEVRRLTGIYGRNGGYIVAPAHNIQDDTPVENIVALFETVKTYNHE